MTASGVCHKCDKVAFRFHYNRPRSETEPTHDGYWHCEDHGPYYEKEKMLERERMEESGLKPRAIRRAEMKKQKRRIKF